jgi:hypothetical protein
MPDIPPSDVTQLFPAESGNGDERALKHHLEELETEHRDLDEVISQLASGNLSDQLQIQRLKKRKLVLKDEIARLHGKLLPDIIA